MRHTALMAWTASPSSAPPVEEAKEGDAVRPHQSGLALALPHLHTAVMVRLSHSHHTHMHMPPRLTEPYTTPQQFHPRAS